MYHLSGSKQVEIWEDSNVPVRNVQMEFNAKRYPYPVVIRTHQGDLPGSSSGSTASNRMTAADMAIETSRRTVHMKKKKEKQLKKFQKTTLKRIHAWNETHAQATEEETAKKKDKVRISRNVQNDDDEEEEDLDLGQSQTSLNMNSRAASIRARTNLLRFTRGRKSFRVISSVQSPNKGGGSPRRHTAPMSSSPVAMMIGSHGLLPQEEVELHQNTIHFAHREEDPLNTSINTSFHGLEEYQNKQDLAKYQAQVRKKEMAFGRLLARRRRALLEHKSQVRKEQEVLCAHRQQQHEKENKMMKQHQQQSSSGNNNNKMSSLTGIQEEDDDESIILNGKSASKHKHKKKKHDESIRYIAALQHRLEELAKSKNGLKLPMLCACNRSVVASTKGSQSLFQYEPAENTMGAPWEHCANNCQFYKNPQAYAKELADLFRSLDL